MNNKGKTLGQVWLEKRHLTISDLEKDVERIENSTRDENTHTIAHWILDNAQNYQRHGMNPREAADQAYNDWHVWAHYRDR